MKRRSSCIKSMCAWTQNDGSKSFMTSCSVYIYERKRLIKTGVEKALQSRQIKIYMGVSSINLPCYNKHKTCERKIIFVKFSSWTQQCYFHKCIPRDNLKHVCGLYVRILICSGAFEEKYQSNTYDQQDHTNGQYIIGQIAVRFNIECLYDGKNIQSIL